MVLLGVIFGMRSDCDSVTRTGLSVVTDVLVSSSPVGEMCEGVSSDSGTAGFFLSPKSVRLFVRRIKEG